MATQEYKTKIRMHQTDSAGVVFFANLFVMAHDCYESWLEQYTSLSEILRQDIQIPIVHAEADYRLPIHLSDQVRIDLALAQKKSTSFSLQYTFTNADGEETAGVQTVHVVINSHTRKPIELPSFLQDALATL